jgi:hypothetical protein
VDILTSNKRQKAVKKPKLATNKPSGKVIKDDFFKLLYYASLELESRGARTSQTTQLGDGMRAS